MLKKQNRQKLSHMLGLGLKLKMELGCRVREGV